MKRATTKQKCRAGRNIDHASKIQHRRLHEARGTHKGRRNFSRRVSGNPLTWRVRCCIINRLPATGGATSGRMVLHVSPFLEDKARANAWVLFFSMHRAGRRNPTSAEASCNGKTTRGTETRAQQGRYKVVQEWREKSSRRFTFRFSSFELKTTPHPCAHVFIIAYYANIIYQSRRGSLGCCSFGLGSSSAFLGCFLVRFLVRALLEQNTIEKYYIFPFIAIPLLYYYIYYILILSPFLLLYSFIPSLLYYLYFPFFISPAPFWLLIYSYILYYPGGAFFPLPVYIDIILYIPALILFYDFPLVYHVLLYFPRGCLPFLCFRACLDRCGGRWMATDGSGRRGSFCRSFLALSPLAVRGSGGGCSGGRGLLKLWPCFDPQKQPFAFCMSIFTKLGYLGLKN